jgi:hypothetical protein
MLVLQRCFPEVDLVAQPTLIGREGTALSVATVEPLVETEPEPAAEAHDPIAALALHVMELVALGGAENKLTKTALRRDVKGGKMLDEALADLEAREMIMYSKEENSQTGRNHTVVELTEAGQEWLAAIHAEKNKLPDGLMSIGVAPELKAWVPELIIQE